RGEEPSGANVLRLIQIRLTLSFEKVSLIRQALNHRKSVGTPASEVTKHRTGEAGIGLPNLLRQVCITAILCQIPQEIFMKLFEHIDIYHDKAPRSGAMNMAIDEALLETARAVSIRFYRWKLPALSFGYFGKFADVAEYVNERDLVRRWTGGGIVFHGDDLTYSIVIPASDAAFSDSSMLIYEKIHCALRDALTANGGRVELAAMGRDAALRRSEPE